MIRNLNSEDGSVEKRPQFEDFLRPNPYLRAWMLPYLPLDRRLQDMSFFVIWSVLMFATTILLHLLGFYDYLAVGIGLAGLAVVGGDMRARHMNAAAKFARAKKLFGLKAKETTNGERNDDRLA